MTHSIRNIVKFQIQEDAETQARELFHRSRTFGGK
jgi:hypothetical protein